MDWASSISCSAKRIWPTDSGSGDAPSLSRGALYIWSNTDCGKGHRYHRRRRHHRHHGRAIT
jgi:hypothetical protein